MIRICIQNLLLILSALCLLVTVGIIASHANNAMVIGFANQCVLLCFALQWCHHGVRTKQIKAYLLLINPDSDGWENWLPANRPTGLLGSRWLVSTKGVFIGLGASSIVSSSVIQVPFSLTPFALSLAVCTSTAVFLLTNPKE